MVLDLKSSCPACIPALITPAATRSWLKFSLIVSWPPRRHLLHQVRSRTVQPTTLLLHDNHLQLLFRSLCASASRGNSERVPGTCPRAPSPTPGPLPGPTARAGWRWIRTCRSSTARRSSPQTPSTAPESLYVLSISGCSCWLICFMPSSMAGSMLRYSPASGVMACSQSSDIQ
jgi:hypothetical protein